MVARKEGRRGGGCRSPRITCSTDPNRHRIMCIKRRSRLFKNHKKRAQKRGWKGNFRVEHFGHTSSLGHGEGTHRCTRLHFYLALASGSHELRASFSRDLTLRRPPQRRCRCRTKTEARAGRRWSLRWTPPPPRLRQRVWRLRGYFAGATNSST